MLNVMNLGKRFLKVQDSEDMYKHNLVKIESNGLIDPYLNDPDEGLSIIERCRYHETVTDLNASGEWRLFSELG